MSQPDSFEAADRLELREVRSLVHLGVTEEERKIPQPVELSVVIATKINPLYRDELSATYDYSLAASIVENLTSSSHQYSLMEFLAQRIVDAILASSDDVGGVEVSVRKLKPPVSITLRDAGFVMRRLRGEM